MRIGKRTASRTLHHEIGSRVKSEKDLGVIFDDKLLFREHIAKKISTCKQEFRPNIQELYLFNQRNVLALYKSLVRPHLEYLTTVWSTMYKKDAMILENTQRKVTKMVNSIT